MLKQALVILLSAGLMMGLSGCTSKKAEEEVPADVAEVAGESEGEATGDEIAATDDGVAELGGDELSPEEQLPEEQADAGDEAPSTGDDFAEPAEELAENPESLEPEAATGEEIAASGPAPEPSAEPITEPPPSTVDESLAAGGEPTPEPMMEEPKKVLPLRKIADTPYEQAGLIVNAVYLARSGDSLDSIATKIYGSTERKKELVKLNPTFKSRDVKVGDKVYYNSPNRPTDNTRLLTYYEDVGLAPEIYVVSKPENIRDIAKALLGDANSWKELWATNMDLESKGELPEGTQLRYWAVSQAPVMAASPTPSPAEEMPPASQAAAASIETAPPPPMDQPPADQMAMNQPPEPPPMEAEPPPPPPPTAYVPPPPPPSAMGETGTGDGGDAGMPSDPAAAAMKMLENPDQTMAMAAGAVLLIAAVGLFIAIRKRKSRRTIDFHTSTQTQIE